MRYEVRLAWSPRGAAPRVLGLVRASSPRSALWGFLDTVAARASAGDRAAESGAAKEARDLLDLLSAPDTCFTVVPDDDTTYFVRDHAGELREPDDMERRRAMMRRDLGVDEI